MSDPAPDDDDDENFPKFWWESTSGSWSPVTYATAKRLHNMREKVCVQRERGGPRTGLGETTTPAMTRHTQRELYDGPFR